MGKTIKITLTDEAAFYMDFLIENENLRYPRILFERLINGAIKKLKTEDRPVYRAEGQGEK